MVYLLLVVAIAAVFYAAVPGVGAFYVRSRWRKFRRRIIRGSLFPIAEYRHLASGPDGSRGNFRFFGNLEAIEGDDVVWIRSETASVEVALNKVSVYWLPSFSATQKEGREELNEENLPDEVPSEISWRRVFSLPEGTQVFITGALFCEHGKSIFRSTKDTPLTVVIYDGGGQTILRRAIWAGRHRNEYWNPFTPGSISVGSFALLILAYLLLRSPVLRFPAIVSLTVSLFPLTPFLPPGLFMFFIYRRWWKRARFLRAERDMVLLPLRYFPDFDEGATTLLSRLPDGEEIVAERWEDEEASLERLGEGKVRRASRLASRPLPERGRYVFGVRVPGSSALVPASDPMAELILIPGNPIELSRQCSRQARQFELLSTVAISAAVLTNLVLSFWILSNLVR